MDKCTIAITGGIGSGKSTVAEQIRLMGFPVFSCDEIYGKIIKSKDYIEKIKNIFPEAVVDEGVDRKKLSKIVFQNKNALHSLNAIAHPLIMEELFKEINENASKLIFAEVPLLFEEGFEDLFDKIIVVIRSKEKRVESLISRDSISFEEAQQRISHQFDYDSAIGRKKIEETKSIVIKNEGSIEELKKNLQILIANLKAL